MDDDKRSLEKDFDDELAERGRLLVAAAVAAPETAAPLALRERLETQRAGTAKAPAPGRRRLVGVLLGGGLAAFAVAIAISALGATAPTVTAIAGLGKLTPEASAPASRGGAIPTLDLDVDGVAFPDWGPEFEWEATGRRTDEADGRRVETVFYRSAKGVTAAYSIVDGAALEELPEGTDRTLRGTRYRVADEGGRRIVTWEEQGHTCVLVAPESVPDDKLVELAAWDNF